MLADWPPGARFHHGCAYLTNRYGCHAAGSSNSRSEA
jgi:hypothetical protein